MSPGGPSRVLADRHPRERQGRCGGGPGTCFYRPSLELFQHFRSVFPTRTNQGHVAAFYCLSWPDLTVNTCLLIHALKMYYCINTSFQQTKYEQYRSVEGEKPSLSTPCLSPPFPGGAQETFCSILQHTQLGPAGHTAWGVCFAYQGTGDIVSYCTYGAAPSSSILLQSSNVSFVYLNDIY